MESPRKRGDRDSVPAPAADRSYRTVVRAPAANPHERARLASLIFSIVGFCVLFVGGIVGVILGFLGLRNARDPNVGGRGMAITGIIIGLLSILTSCIILGGFYYGLRGWFQFSAPPRQAARQFVQDLGNGNVQAASGEVTPDITPAELQAMSSKLRALGAFRDMTSSQIHITDSNGLATCTLHGVANFANGDQTYDITLKRQGHVHWAVSQAQFP